jgi:ATPase subunit of ABC transporter with duplicated ATPase domains
MHDRPDLAGRSPLDVLVSGDADRPGTTRGDAMRAMARYGLAGQAEQRFDTLSGGQQHEQARLLVLLLELSGATVTVTHDRWFTRGFDRFVVFSGDGAVRETSEPVWEPQELTRAS